MRFVERSDMPNLKFCAGWWFDIIMKYLNIIDHPLKYIDDLPFPNRPTEGSPEAKQLDKLSEDLIVIYIRWDISKGDIESKFKILEKEIVRIEESTKYRIMNMDGSKKFTYLTGNLDSSITDLVFYKLPDLK